MNELAKQELQPTLSPLVKLAMSKEIDTEKLKELLEIQKDYEANEAKKAYHKAVAAFKAEAPKVVKDKKNSQYNNSAYVSKEALVNTINPFLSKHGLSTHWEPAQADNMIKITCILTHELGHSESASMSGPPDTSGSKNPIQQIKSTKTYLEIATYEAITGIASEGGSCNDDGNSASIENLSKTQANTIHSMITDNDLDMTAFLKYRKTKSIETIPASAFKQTIESIKAVIAKRASK